MTSNARRPGFRLPWLSGEPEGQDEASQAPGEGESTTGDTGARAPSAGERAGVSPEDAGRRIATAASAPLVGAARTGPSEAGRRQAAAAGVGGTPGALLREMVDAMRSVAEQARDSSLAEVRRSVEHAVGSLRTAAAQRAAELRRRAGDDLAEIGEWAAAEAERIRREAESRATARRDRLEQELAVEGVRAERDIEAVQARVADYERELSNFFANLREIDDPAAFAAAVRRMPKRPSLAAGERHPDAAHPVAADADAGREAGGSEGGDSSEAADAPRSDAPTAVPGPAEEPGAERADGPPAEPPLDDFSQIIVQGLGSFGAITAFKQSLERVDGIGAVTLALGPTGEFVYRAAHRTGFDIEAAVSGVEAGAQLRRDPDGTLRVIVARG